MRRTRTLLVLPLALLAFLPVARAAGPSATAGSPGTTINATLHALRARAIERSPELRAAAETFDAQHASSFSALARWLPRVELQLMQSRSQDYSLLTSGALGSFFPAFTPAETSLSRWSLNATFPIYQRSVHLGFQQSLRERELAETQLEARRTELDWRLRSLLGDYLLHGYKLASLEHSVELARQSLKDAKVRFETGERTRVDVIRAEANLISFESRRLGFLQDQSKAFSALLEYTGLDRLDLRTLLRETDLSSEGAISSAIDQLAATGPLLTAVSPYLPSSLAAEATAHATDTDADRDSLLALETRLADHSPLLRTYFAQESVSETQARATMSGEWPTLAAQASLGKQGNDWDTALSPGQRSHSVSLVLTIPLFTGGSLVSSAYQKSHLREAAAVRREQDVQRLRHEVADMRIQIRALERTLEAQRLTRERNEELVRLSQKSYQLGRTSLLELLTSENDLLSSKLELVQTKLNLAVVLRRFAWNLGISGVTVE